MPKEAYTFTIEPTLANEFRRLVPQRQRSQVISRLIKGFIGDEEGRADEFALAAELEEIKKQEGEVQQAKARVVAALDKLEEEKAEDLEKAKAAAAELKDYNPARFIE